MNPEYYALRFEMGTNDSEIWLAMLSEWPFESFHEEKHVITGYIQLHDIREEMMHFITEREGLFFDDFEMTKVPDKNWNEVWESNFEPVVVDDFCAIRAEFHKPIQNVQHEIIITPKMSFGTGHHATTYMMIQQMRNISFIDKKVFDFGTGTGILAILATKLGAASVTAIDNDEWSIKNAEENFEKNNVHSICLYQSSTVSEKNFDIILANINRSVLEQYSSTLVNLLSSQGVLLVSGLLKEDEPFIVELFDELTLYNSQQNQNWISLLFTTK